MGPAGGLFGLTGVAVSMVGLPKSLSDLGVVGVTTTAPYSSCTDRCPFPSPPGVPYVAFRDP